MPANNPVLFHAEMPTEPRKRLSAFARPLLIIPHLLLVGGPIVGFGIGFYRTGALGLVAWTAALIDWFAILFTGRAVAGLQPLKRLYLHWRAPVLAYAAFLRDEYPPFGTGAHPVTLDLPEEIAGPRSRGMIFLRPLLVLPHAVVLALLLFIWFFVSIACWLLLSVAARMPGSFWRYSRDVMAYSLRVEAYVLLLHDEYPPFSLTQG